MVGLDFSFGFPSWFANSLGVTDAASLWAVTAAQAEEWLGSCNPPFWGRPGKANPHEGERGFRQTELALRPGFVPKSTFQIGGAGSVGTGSLRGIPFLLELVEARFAIWPFSPVGQCTVVEMYPRMHTGPVVKSNEAARSEYLMRPRMFADVEISGEILHRAVGSEDAFDALLSAVGMWRRVVAGSLPPLPATLPAGAAIEGWIW